MKSQAVTYTITEKGKKSIRDKVRDDSEVYDADGNKHYYYGSFYCAYKENGSAFVWIPRWIRTTVLPHDAAIKELLIKCLEEAPLKERKLLAARKIGSCNSCCGYPDDHDLASYSYHVTDEAVSAGGDAYIYDGVKSAFHNGTTRLMVFIDGVSHDQ